MTYFGGRCSGGNLVNLLNNSDYHGPHYRSGRFSRFSTLSPTTGNSWSSPPGSPVGSGTAHFGCESPAWPSSPSSSRFSTPDSESAQSSLVSYREEDHTHQDHSSVSWNSRQAPSECSSTPSQKVVRATPPRDASPATRSRLATSPKAGGKATESRTPARRPPRVCPDCKRTFTTSGHLSRHMRIHTGIKPYKCLLKGCSSVFSRQDNMMQHYRTHLLKLERSQGTDSAFVVQLDHLTDFKSGLTLDSAQSSSRAHITPQKTKKRLTSARSSLKRKQADVDMDDDQDMPPTPSKAPRKRGKPAADSHNESENAISRRRGRG